MISFRYHVVSLVAVLLALAAGVALGAGPLQERMSRIGAQPSAATTSAPTDPSTATVADSLVAAAAPALYDDGLANRRVALLTMPGADQSVVTDLSRQVREAGGVVNVTYRLKDGLTDPTEKPLVESLGAQLADQLGDGFVSPGATTYPRMGELIGLAVATATLDKGALSPKAGTVQESLTAGDLVATTGHPTGAAPVVLVVMGQEPRDQIDATAVLAGLLTGLDRKAVGVVVAGSTQAPQIDALRAEPLAAGVATVDGVETPAGRVATVLTLMRSLRGQGGEFGATGEDGVAPLDQR